MVIPYTVSYQFIFFVLIYLRGASSFNIDPSRNRTKYLTPTRNKYEQDRSSFYGYNLKFTKSKELFITSTNWQNSKQLNSADRPNASTKSVGPMAKCVIRFNGSDSCRKTQFANFPSPDLSGLAIDVNGGRIRACLPSKVLDCGVTHRVPGFCYESTNNGQTWKWLKRNQPQCPKMSKFNLDIVFVLDGSFSVKNNFNDILTWTQRMAAKFDVESKVNQIGVVHFSSFERGKALENQTFITTEIKLGSYKRNRPLNRAIKNIRRKGVMTYTAHALNKTVTDFQRGPRWDDENTKKVMVVLTDGEATDGAQLEDSAKYVRSLDIVPFAVGVGKGFNTTQLQIIATGDLNSTRRVLNVKRFDQLGSIVKELTAQIMQVVLEGSGKKRIASYKLELGQRGFAITSSPRVNSCKTSHVKL